MMTSKLVIVAALVAAASAALAQNCNGDSIPDDDQDGPFTAPSMRFGANGADAVVVSPLDVQIGTLPSYTAQQFTLQFWQKGITANGSSAVIAMPDVVANRLNVHTPWSDGRVYFDFGNANTVNGREVCDLPPGLSDDWHHWAFVANGFDTWQPDRMRVYCDGVLLPAVGTEGSSPVRQFSNATGPLQWLAIGSRASNGFEGEIAELRMEFVARTASEIQAGMLAPPLTNPPYRFTFGGSGTTISNLGALTNQDATILGADGRFGVWKGSNGILDVCAGGVVPNFTGKTLALPGETVNIDATVSNLDGDLAVFNLERYGAFFQGPVTATAPGVVSFQVTTTEADIPANYTLMVRRHAKLTFETTGHVPGPQTGWVTYVDDAFLEISGQGADVVIEHQTRYPSHLRFTAFTLDTANLTGAGWWYGLHIPFPDLASQFFIGTQPFVGMLDGSGSELTTLPGIAPALVGLDIYAVTVVFSPTYSVVGATLRSFLGL